MHYSNLYYMHYWSIINIPNSLRLTGAHTHTIWQSTAGISTHSPKQRSMLNTATKRLIYCNIFFVQQRDVCLFFSFLKEEFSLSSEESIKCKVHLDMFSLLRYSDLIGVHVLLYGHLCVWVLWRCDLYVCGVFWRSISCWNDKICDKRCVYVCQVYIDILKTQKSTTDRQIKHGVFIMDVFFFSKRRAVLDIGHTHTHT